ncbi:hypothetical protein KJS94_05215 [Flavihumibacter rivuli]|uniref:hypothetical protein n=1 Tax=Flavihumibacter rivuli TaxID=2838156 RepID=UPI001BDE830E|nr:hypothetical protein [Flavihumibacter rivuli]ULQ57598.1 hypothetical protein KJS94_05215 [Flavihumibacter rivuli]
MKAYIFSIILVLYGLWPDTSLAQTTGGMVLEKKTAYVGLLLSYTNSTKEYVEELFQELKYARSVQFSIQTGGGYFIKKNTAIGLGLGIEGESSDQEAINAIGPNTFTNKNIHSYFLSPFIRHYFGLGKANRLYLFTQTGLQFGIGKGDETLTTGTKVTTTDIKKNDYRLAFTPGIILIVEKGFAFELNVGVLGFDYAKETRTTPDEPQTVITETNVDLNINLLRLKLGIAYYF